MEVDSGRQGLRDAHRTTSGFPELEKRREDAERMERGDVSLSSKASTASVSERDNEREREREDERERERGEEEESDDEGESDMEEEGWGSVLDNNGTWGISERDTWLFECLCERPGFTLDGVTSICKTGYDPVRLTALQGLKDVLEREVRASRKTKTGDARKKGQTLRDLDLFGSSIDDIGAKEIAALLKVTRRGLQTLALSDNRIGNEGVGHICRALEGNLEIQNLRLDGNRVTTEGLKSVGQLLQETQFSELLRSPGGGRNGHENDRGGVPPTLADVMQPRSLRFKTCNLRSLSLSRLSAGDTGVAALCQGLQAC